MPLSDLIDVSVVGSLGGIEMREIKFRTWLPKQKIFHYWGFNLHEDEAWFHGPPNEPKAPQMQFTGLLDKEGKEIYKGDIVSDTSAPFPEDKIFEIGWDNYNAGFSLRTKNNNWPKRDDGYSYAGWLHEAPKIFEVIGNIYEHPELVK